MAASERARLSWTMYAPSESAIVAQLADVARTIFQVMERMSPSDGREPARSHDVLRSRCIVRAPLAVRQRTRLVRVPRTPGRVDVRDRGGAGAPRPDAGARRLNAGRRGRRRAGGAC